MTYDLCLITYDREAITSKKSVKIVSRKIFVINYETSC
jgi:hypothetical protein